jgi:hypothetical protein
MLKSTILALFFGASLWAFGELASAPIDRALYAALVVGLGSATAVLAYGQASFLPVSTGAVSPLLFALVQAHSIGLATSLMCFSWIAPRLVLAETRARFVMLLLFSSVAASVAGFMFASHVDAPWSAHVAACIFAGSCLSLVSLVGVESTVAFALRSAASVTDLPTRDNLERAARAHRASFGASSPKQWRALIRLADQRAALARAKDGSEAARKNLDEQIATLAEELAPFGEPSPSQEPSQAPSKATPEATS